MPVGTKFERVIFAAGHELLFVSGGVRRVNLRVRRDASIRVSAPTHVSEAQVVRFVEEHATWLEEQLRHVREQSAQKTISWKPGHKICVLGEALALRLEQSPRPSVQREAAELVIRTPQPDPTPDNLRSLCTPWLKGLLTEASLPLLDRYGGLMGARHSSLRLRWMRTRWGSCNVRTAIVCLNLELALRPPECLESVVVHELCHLLEPSHSARFYELMDHYLPSWREGQEILRGQPPSR
ncbi:M48 family metallopeptidase [Olsenella urininfantis]|uniref:M48 family metallopeptidase n=1 Tax=Olsenella urininfantis TaxID=1871033 RepID=UPI00135669C2|nr:SprT family zinc-dependent metalloprotease [Olsenella urininfantis]